MQKRVIEKIFRVHLLGFGILRHVEDGLYGFFGHVAERAPLKRNIDAEEVGKTALYLCSDWGSAVTGEVLHVDAGYNIMGM